MRPNWFVLATMLSTSLLAQQITNTPPAGAVENPATAPALTNAPAAITNAPSAEKAPATKKASPKKKAAPKKAAAGSDLKTVPLVAGPAVVAANRVNVRGQAKLNSEVVTQLNKGQEVTVIEEITLKNSGPDEPSAWAKIQLPTNVNVWVHGSFIDAANKTVSPRRLNVRSGPGENYSVLGRLERGTPVKEVTSKGEWIQIEAPTNAYAFMAAQYLKQEPGAQPGETPAKEPVTEPPAVAAAPTEAPDKPETPAATTAATEPSTAAAPATTTGATEPAANEPPPIRIIQREGFVRGSVSIQAPSHFELVDAENGKVIDYLYTTSPDLDLKRYKGLHIYVTGEEGLDERWPNTPVLTIHAIEVLD